MTSEDIEEVGQQIGDQMASIDEAGGTTGSISLMDGARRTFARLSPEDVHDSWLESLILPSAYAVSCAGYGFDSCTNNVITRTFNGCTVGLATFNGTVTLTYTDDAFNNTCQMTASGHKIVRVPNFTVTGRRGATLSVIGPNGQEISRGASAGTFTFWNNGVRRTFTKDGTTLFDYTTQTTTAINVTGANRSNRVIDGGVLEVINNLGSRRCNFVPSNVTWTSSCNCATSGSWSASCSDGKSSTLTLTGCGTANLTLGDIAASVTLDRCIGT